jgi:O-antigen ligase
LPFGKLLQKLLQKTQLLGVGTGDVKDALISEYDKQTVDEFTIKKLNAHNQYLQTFIALGLAGILVLLILLCTITILLGYNKMYDGTLLTVIIAFNMLFESMLETQAGVVFIAFFLMLYFSNATKNIRTKKLII